MRSNLLEPSNASCQRSRGKTAVLAAVAVVFAIGAALCLIYPPWNLLRYGRQEPPVVASAELEPPLAERIAQRLEAVRAAPYDGAAWGRLGETYEVHDFLPQAIECYQRAEELAPDEPRWPYWLGLAQRIGDQRSALAAFERALESAPDWAALHFYVAHGYLSLERPADAAREFQRAHELQPDAPAALIGQAKAALAQGEPQRALDSLAQVEKLKASSGEARWLQAAAWRALGDEAKALAFAAPGEPPPAQEPFPDDRRANMFLEEGVSLHWARRRAEILLARKEGELAVAELQRYVERTPQSAEALVALGDLYMKLGKPADALPRYQAACTLDPTRADAIGQWGIALEQTGEREEGVAKLRQALALDPERVEFQSTLGTMLAVDADAAKREEGLALLLRVSEARPKEVSSWFNLAQALGRNGRGTEAVAAFQRALELAPDDVGLLHSFGILTAQVGNVAEAADVFARVVAAEPSRMDARLNLIQALREVGRDREAIGALREARERAPKAVQLRAQLAWTLATSPDEGARNGGEALGLARELTQETQDTNPEFLVIRAAAEAETGDLAAALKTVEVALDLMRPVPPAIASDQKYTGIIDRALACRTAFQAGAPYRAK